MKQSVTVALGAAALVAGISNLALSQPMGASGSPGSPTMMIPSDAQFVRGAFQSNDEEIATARYVLRFSKNPAVRAFATQMIADHSTSDVSLEKASRDAHVAAPERRPTPMLPAALQGVTEPQLDAAYVQQQIDAHDMALSAITSESTGGKSPELRAFASAQAPIVKSHLDLAQNIMTAMPNRTHASSSVEPAAPAGVNGQAPRQGNLVAPPTPMTASSGSPNPQPSVGIPATVPSPGPSGSPHA